MSKQRKVYSREYKEQAVVLVETGNKPLVEIAQDLGINANMLRRWCNELKESGDRGFPGQGHRKQGTDLEEEYRRLQQQLLEVKMERDLLKKAIELNSKLRK